MDKLFKGLLAGVIGAVFMNVINLIFYYIFDLTDVRFLDWAGIVMLGSRPNTTIEIIYALIIHILWTGTLGIIFSYLTPQITLQGYLLKGGLYGFLLTFIFHSITILYDITFLNQVSVETSMINTISSFLWGVILASMLNRFNKDLD